MGFVSGINLFTDVYYPAPQSDINKKTVGDVETMLAPSKMGISDYFVMAVTFLVGAIFVVFTTASAAVIQFPYLVWVFHVPMELAAVLQGAIWLEYAMGWAQWRSGRPGRSME